MAMEIFPVAFRNKCVSSSAAAEPSEDEEGFLWLGFSSLAAAARTFFVSWVEVAEGEDTCGFEKKVVQPMVCLIR